MSQKENEIDGLFFFQLLRTGVLILAFTEVVLPLPLPFVNWEATVHVVLVFTLVLAVRDLTRHFKTQKKQENVR